MDWFKPFFDRYPCRRILFRTDGGSIRGLSFGHLKRSLALAKEFETNFGAHIRFLSRNYADGVDLLRAEKMAFSLFRSDSDPAGELHVLNKEIDTFSPDMLIVDLPYDYVDEDYFLGIEKKCRAIFVDDSRFISPRVDIVWNSSILAEERVPRHSGTEYLLGTKYLVFPSTGIEEDSPGKLLNRITITFGGSDPSGLTKKVLMALNERVYPKKLLFNVILGPGYKDQESIKKLCQESENRISLFVNPENIYQMFLSSRLVICAGGRTPYELLKLKIPFFALASIRHEVEPVEILKERGFAMDSMTEWHSATFLSKLSKIIGKLFNES